MRRWALWAGACVFLIGCAREVFDHSAAESSRDGGRADAGPDAMMDAGPAEVDCATAEPGTRCDDRNVCTPASTCRDQQCLAGTTSRECWVAGNVESAEDEQGQAGWYYGYWTAGDDEDDYYDATTDFTPMEYCEDGNWRPPGICALTRDDEGFRWTSNLGFALQHPETMPELELPVRRWVSPVSGPARLVVKHRVGGTYSDGTRAILLLDGDELWRHDGPGSDTVGAMMTFDVELEVGTVIDQLVHPIGNSSDDTTYFELRVEGR